ncbi:MAG: hypothetical protein NVSMB7_14360 [Chitinophagaceae bacterium]
MKKLMVIVVALGLAMGASAQRFGHGGGREFGGGHVYIAPPRVAIGIGGYSPFYSPFGYYPYAYPPYEYNNEYNNYARPSKLQMQVEDIKSDYNDKIWSARHDDSITRKEKRKVIHQLKNERDKAIYDAKRNYYKY